MPLLPAAELTKQKASWEAEMASLQQQITQRSKVCDFVKKDSEEGRYSNYYAGP